MDCFVIIEYKNVKNKQILDQGATYYRLLREQPSSFVLLYNHLKNKQRKLENFNWDESYVIFLSPEFTKYQVGASGIGLPVELWKFFQYGSEILMVQRVDDTLKMRTKLSNTADKKRYVRLDEYDEEEYLNGKYGAPGCSSQTRELYFDVKRRILEEFEDLNLNQKKVYVGFYLPNNKCICTLDVGKSKIKLTYSIASSKNILIESEFVRDVTNIGKFGVGDYQSELNSEGDIKKALRHIQKVYDYKCRL